MASIINASTTGVGGVITTADNTGILTLQTASTTAVTIDASQRAAFVAGTAALPAITTTGDTNTGIWFPAADTIAFAEGGAESMRIDSSGNVLVGTTSNTPSNGTAKQYNLATGTTVGLAVSVNNTGYSLVNFFYNNATNVGSINTNGTTSAYNTTSDYRLKENIVPMTGALDKVALLKPVTYTWKSDGSDGQGFIAHELQEVVPDCVTGEKDAVDEEGNIKPQGIDTSFLVATLTAAIQEQQTIINDLKARITVLEAK